MQKMFSEARKGRAALLALAAVLMLPGCQTNRAESARQLMQQQEEEQAMARMEDDAANQRAASRPQMALSLIRKEQEEGRFFASLAYLDAYRQTFGDVPEASAMRADALRKTGQPQASEQAYRALTSGPEAARAWHGLGLLAGMHGDFGQAAQHLRRATQLRPTDAQYLGDLGYALLRAGDSRQARVPLGQAAELAPDNAKILANLALLLLVEGDPAGARQVMDRANLSNEARNQVQQLAAQVRAPVATPVASAGPAAVSAAGRPVVRNMSADKAAASPAPAAQGATAALDRQDGMVMPVLSRQGPLMNSFGNPPVTQ
ncbi:Flp pilus assembly protein [Bordetella ansorpii]|uniref:Flp pilus assembly protein n=2 Tax=Bordetella ansorpii TaxID=288768 RepID=A0A157RM16_9BORD|nr:Flp pilus assembly protein [Bordetella ansorpii]